jgi:hypothetical protein
MCSCEDRSGTFRSRQGAKALALFIRGMNCTMSYVGGNGCNRRHGGYAPTARSNRWSSRFSIGALPVMVREGGSASDPRPSVIQTVMAYARLGMRIIDHARPRSALSKVDRPRCRIGRLPVTYIYMNGSRYVRRLPRFFGSPVMRLWSLETLYSAVRGRTSPFSGSSRGGVREAERGRGRLVGRRTSTPTPAPSHTGAGARRRGGGAHAAPVTAALPRPASRFPGRPGVGQSPNLTAARAPMSPVSAVSTSLISEQLETVVQTPEPQPASGMSL